MNTKFLSALEDLVGGHKSSYMVSAMYDVIAPLTATGTLEDDEDIGLWRWLYGRSYKADETAASIAAEYDAQAPLDPQGQARNIGGAFFLKGE